jgi:hypothetical protein
MFIKLVLVGFIATLWSALWAYSMKSAFLVKKPPEKKDD